MIRANCRARFTAADFDFIVRTLARSQTDQVSLVDLLSDIETRDSILDHPRLVDAILNHCGHLRISSQFYFYVLARHVLQEGGIGDRKLCDYIASLLETFSRASRLQICDETHHLAEQYISDRRARCRGVKKRKGNEGYDVAADEYTDLVKAGIVDPTKVTRTALQNAASIAGLLLTTEALVTEIPEKEKTPPMPPGGMGGMDY